MSLKKLSDEKLQELIDIVSVILFNVGDLNTAISYLGAFFSNHILKENAEKVAKESFVLVEGLEEWEDFKGHFLQSYDECLVTDGLSKLCEILVCDELEKKYYCKELTAICGINESDLSYIGEYEFSSERNQYIQKNRQIYSIKETKGNIELIPKAIFSVDKITRYTDVLGLSEPLYTLVYYHGYDNELKTIEFATKEQILKILMNEDLFNTNVKEAEGIFRSIRHSLHTMGLMKKQKTILYRGFFIDDEGKLMSNTNVDGLTTSTDDLKEAILLLIKVLDSNIHSAYENATVLRKLLGMPFYFCIKQLGFAEDNTNGLILYGKAKTGKTSICKIGLWFYLEEPYNYNASTDTLSSLVRRLSTTTFYTLFDDSYGLLNDPAVQNTIKKGMYEKYSRTVSDRDSKDVLEYLALSTPVFTYNEHIPIIDDGLERRLDKIKYDKKNVISRDDSIAFKMEYNPLTKESILEKLHHIGIAFKQWITPKLESSAIELNDMEALTLDFFTETLSNLGLQYPPLTSSYDYETTIEDYGAIIRNHFNKELLKSRLISNNGVSIGDLMNVADTGYFSWLGYQPRNHQFIILVDSFITECSRITNHSFSFEDLMLELGITDYKVENQIKVKGKTPKATKIKEDDLVHNILNINCLLHQRDDEYDF